MGVIQLRHYTTGVKFMFDKARYFKTKGRVSVLKRQGMFMFVGRRVTSQPGRIQKYLCLATCPHFTVMTARHLLLCVTSVKLPCAPSKASLGFDSMVCLSYCLPGHLYKVMIDFRKHFLSNGELLLYFAGVHPE